MSVSNDEREVILKLVRLTAKAFPPTRGSEKAAGFDLKSAYEYFVPRRGKIMIETDIKIELLVGCYGRIAPRSGLAAKNSIHVRGGVIDEDYRGPVKITLFNFSDEDFHIKPGDKIAQLICEKVFYPELGEEKELTITNRGGCGFGSTDIK